MSSYIPKKILFGSKTCRPCQQIKKLMEAKGIDYEYIEVTADNAEQYGITAVPTLMYEKFTGAARYVGAPEIKERLGL